MVPVGTGSLASGRSGVVSGLLGRVSLALGDAPGARRIVTEARGEGDERAREAPLAMVEALAALGDWDGLRGYLPEARRMMGVMALLRPVAERAEGRMGCALGNIEAGLEQLRLALEGFESMSVPFEAARTKEALADVVAGAGGRRLLEEALATYEALGARPHAERVRAGLG